MFTKDPFQIYHDSVNKNIERMKKENKLIVSSQQQQQHVSQQQIRHLPPKRQPLSNITTKVNKPVMSTRKLLSKFETKPKRETLLKSNNFKVLPTRGFNTKYTKITTEFSKNNQDPIVDTYSRNLDNFINWFKLNKFQFKVNEKEGEPQKKKIIDDRILENTIRSNYIRPEYGRYGIVPTHTILKTNKLSEFMYVVKIRDIDSNDEKIIILLNISDCKIKPDDKLNLNELCYLMNYNENLLEVYIRWQLVR